MARRFALIKDRHRLSLVSGVGSTAGASRHPRLEETEPCTGVETSGFLGGG